MTNDEPLNSSHTISKKEIDYIIEYNLPYDKTEWGVFYETYKKQGQLQLQKALEKNKNSLLSMNNKSKYDKQKHIQSIFYASQWNTDKEEWETPPILLRHTKRGYDDSNWCNDNYKFQQITLNALKSYNKRCLAEHKEVKAFYEQRKTELKLDQKEAHKSHANEKITCPFCQKAFARTNFARHKKTNKKCLEAQALKKGLVNNIGDYKDYIGCGQIII